MDIARCDPANHCPQAERCARYLDKCSSVHVSMIDASASLGPNGCALFIDTKGVDLIAIPKKSALTRCNLSHNCHR